MGGLADRLGKAGRPYVLSDPLYLDPGRGGAAGLFPGVDLATELARAWRSKDRLSQVLPMSESWGVVEVMGSIPGPGAEGLVRAARHRYEGMVADKAFRSYVGALRQSAEIEVNPNFTWGPEVPAAAGAAGAGQAGRGGPAGKGEPSGNGGKAPSAPLNDGAGKGEPSGNGGKAPPAALNDGAAKGEPSGNGGKDPTDAPSAGPAKGEPPADGGRAPADAPSAGPAKGEPPADGGKVPAGIKGPQGDKAAKAPQADQRSKGGNKSKGKKRGKRSRGKKRK
jgi:hypothetical protein